MPWKDRIPIVCMIVLFTASAVTYALWLAGFFFEILKPWRPDLGLIADVFFFAGAFLFMSKKYADAHRKLKTSGIT